MPLTPSTVYDNQFFSTDSPLPPPFKSKSTHSRDTRTSDFCKLISSFYTYKPLYLTTKAANFQHTDTKQFLDPYIFALYYQKFTNLQKFDDQDPIVLHFTSDIENPSIFSHSFLTQDIYSTLGIFLSDLINQTPVEEPEESQYPYPHSDIIQFETFFRDPDLEQTIQSLRQQYPLVTVQDHTTLDLEITIFCVPIYLIILKPLQTLLPHFY